MKIYVSGPYIIGDVEQNVLEAIKAGDAIIRMGHTPFVPHLTHFWHLLIPHDYEYWMQLDKDWLECCEAILRLPGESKGADLEIKWAEELGLEIYYHI